MNLLNSHKTFIVAELSANHNQNFDIAVNTIKAAKEAGADAFKLQTYTADTMTIDCNNEYFTINCGSPWDGRSLYQLYKEASTPWDWFPKLKEIGSKIGIMVFSTPFDKTSVDFLEENGNPIIKIASFEITDISLIEYAASKGKPMLISTGVAELSEIEEAVLTCRKNNNNQITLLKCTSSYPAPINEANLLTMVDMKQRFNVEVGLSDHTLGNDVSVAAVALGAKVIEKHFILDKRLGGPDSSFSIEPGEFKMMVQSIREIEKSIGDVTYDLSDKSKINRKFTRSLFVVNDVKNGDYVTENNVKSIRPGDGMPPKYYKYVIGKRFKMDVKKGTPLDSRIIEE
jgi:pseudaminic acid synthase